MSAATEVVDYAGDVVGGAVETVGDVASGATEAVSDVGSSVDDFVNDEIPGGWATVAIVASPTVAGAVGVPASAIPYVAPATSAAVTLDQGGSLEDAALNAALTYGAQELAKTVSGGATSSFAPEMGDELVPFDDVLSGLDIGDVIPTTPEQLRGLYETGGVFRPPMEGIDMGETIPFTPEQVSGLYPDNGAFLPVGYTGTEGLDTGDVIPYTEQQIAGLYPTDGKFTPPYVLPSVKDLANAAVAAKTVDSLLNPPSTGGGTTSGGGFAIVPIPSDWRSPTYNQAFTPIDLNSLFTTANLLGGTQWATRQPEIEFAARPTMEALTKMISKD